MDVKASISLLLKGVSRLYIVLDQVYADPSSLMHNILRL